MKRILWVAYHFPPLGGSSGLLRSLKLSRYLRDYGLSTVVLTIHPRAYERLDYSLMNEVPPEVKVIRAFGLDTRKHLSIYGRYPRWLALPDRWVSWCLGGIPAGLFTIHQKKIDVVLTTFPIATAVLIGFMLHKITSKPWVVDFRDSMTEENYPPDPMVHRVYRWIERLSVKHAAYLIFTAESARRMYTSRYPFLRPEQCLLIPNGYDEQDFASIGSAHIDLGPNLRPIRLLHLGLIYPEERNPIPFFRSLARLKSEGRICSSNLSVDLRASGSEHHYSNVASELGISDIVHLLPPLPYRQSLQDASSADGLLLLQSASCNHQIPAKAYEYLRLCKPILALTHEAGDTASLLREVGGASIVDIENEDAISEVLLGFLESLKRGHHCLPDLRALIKYERSRQAEILATCISRLG